MSMFRRRLIMQKYSIQSLPNPIASYRCYDKTNDDEDRDVLKDLSGNGHDIQLYNFAFTEESGYNKSTYNGALVSDGVDDYGVCFPFLKLSSDKGYTVFCINKYLDVSPDLITGNAKVLLSKRITDNRTGETLSWGEFTLDKYQQNINYRRLYNYGLSINANLNNKIKLDILSSSYFNGESINKGESNPTDCLTLFAGFSVIDSSGKITSTAEFGKFAIYALEIYDSDLTDEEIAKVKEIMIAEYEQKTGNKYEEETV